MCLQFTLIQQKFINYIFLSFLMKQCKSIDKETNSITTTNESKANIYKNNYRINRAIMTKQQNGLPFCKVNTTNKVIEIIELDSESSNQNYKQKSPFTIIQHCQNQVDKTRVTLNDMPSNKVMPLPTTPIKIQTLQTFLTNNLIFSSINTLPQNTLQQWKEKQQLVLNQKDNTDNVRENIAKRITACKQKEKEIQQKHKQYAADTERQIAKKSPKSPKEAYLRKQFVKTYGNELFFERRINPQGEHLDLGVMSLDQVVDQSYKHQIIEPKIYWQYIRYSNEQKIAEFITLFVQDKLSSWNFQELKITLIDHRRLAELLVRLYPQQYKISCPYAWIADTRSFLINLYTLLPLDYQRLLKSLDKISELTIWNEIQIKYKNAKSIRVLLSPITSKMTKNQFDESQKQEKRKFEEEVNLRLREYYHIEKYRQSLCKKLGKEKKVKNKKKNDRHDQRSSSFSSESCDEKQTDRNKLKRFETYSCESISYSSSIQFSDKMRKRPCL